jgi:hypothetical protein
MGQNRSDRRKRCHKTSLCTTKPLHGLTREPTRGSEGEKPATDRLSHGTVTMLSTMKQINII